MVGHAADRYRSLVSTTRRCSRTACSAPASATLTYVYAESQALVGPLAFDVEPHQYDLCAEHAERLTVPRGWAVVRDVAPPVVVRHELRAMSDDLEALADAVREAARTALDPTAAMGGRGHLRVLRSPS
jgi:hypothetical protein